MRRGHPDERGATLVIVGLTLVVLLVMAAFAVDLGAAYNVRRQSQSAVDTGALGGALALQDGVAAASEEAAAIVRSNLDESYTDDEWRAAWAACTDDGAKTLQGQVLGATTECISVDVVGILRVRVPDQLVDTAFATAVGVDTISVAAEAEAVLTAPGTGGVLPFALLAGAGSGTQVCVRSSTSGQASPPCDGPESGNFGALESPQYGNPALGTEALPCNLNKTDQLAVNISAGIDHYIRQNTGTDILDSCAKPFGPTLLNTFQGISGGLWEGMVAGAEVSGTTFPGRLTLGDGPKRTLRHAGTSHPVDDTPLWSFIPLGKGAPGSTVPEACWRETFDALAEAQRPAQLQTCLTEYTASDTTEPLFDLDADGDDELDVLDTPRFGIVPQFQESSFPSGDGYLRIGGFRGVYFHGLYAGCTGGAPCTTVYEPGTGSSPIDLPNGSSPLDQVTAYLLPDGAIDQDLLEGEIDGAGPFQVSLLR